MHNRSGTCPHCGNKANHPSKIASIMAWTMLLVTFVTVIAGALFGRSG